MKVREHRPGHDPSPRTAAHRDHTVAPGKRTLTMGLAARRPTGAGPLQRRPVTAHANPPRSQAADGPVEDWMAVALRPDLHQAPIMRKSISEVGYAGADTACAPASGGGAPMHAVVQSKMEHAFGADFSAVRIHQGPEAQAVGALAYTQGSSIHFAPGQYDPGSQRGQELIGHELAHVVQQSQGRVSATTQAKGVSINDDASLEREADAMGARAARGEPAGGSAARGPLAAGSGVVQCMRITLQSGQSLQTEQFSRQQLEEFIRLALQANDVDAALDLDWAIARGDYQGGNNPSVTPSDEEERLRQRHRQIRVYDWKAQQSQPQGTVLERILAGVTIPIDIQERPRKYLEKMPSGEEGRHRVYLMAYPEQMLEMYQLQNLTPVKLGAFRDLPLPVLELLCAGKLLAFVFSLPVDKVSCIATFSLDRLQILLQAGLLVPVCDRMQVEVLSLLAALSPQAFSALGPHLLTSLDELTGLRKSRLQKLLTQPLERFLAVMSLSGADIVELYGAVQDESRLGRMTVMQPSVFVRFLALRSDCRLTFLSLDNLTVKQFFANPPSRQEALMNDAEIGAMGRIVEQDAPYAPRLGTSPKENIGIHMPHSLSEHGAHVGNVDMQMMAQSSPVDRKSRWASAEVQERCMAWARANYKSLQYIGQEGCYVGSNIEISNVGPYPAAGEVFHKGGQQPVPTTRFSVTIYLDQEGQPHVFTAYPVP
jgi:hypothetical protein